MRDFLTSALACKLVSSDYSGPVQYKKCFFGGAKANYLITETLCLLQEVDGADADEEKWFSVHKALISALDTAVAEDRDFQELPGDTEEALAEAKTHNKKGVLTSENQAPQSDLARELVQMPKAEFKERITNILKNQPGALGKFHNSLFGGRECRACEQQIPNSC